MESLLRVVALRHTKVASAGLQALASLFKQESQMSGEMQGQIIMNLYSSKPANFDHPITTVWLEALSAGYTHLATLEPKLGVIMAHTLFSTCSETMLSAHNGVTQTTLVTLEEFCASNLVPGVQVYQQEIREKKKIPLSKVVAVLKVMLRLTYQPVWDVVLQTLSSLLQFLPGSCTYLIEPLIAPLFAIRDAPNFDNNSLFTTTAGKVLKLLGAEKLLKVYPLSIEDGDTVDIPNGWLVPILRDNISQSQLSFFVSDLVPLTATLRARTDTLKQENKALEARVCFNLEYQLWGLLPSFCKSPTDLLASFRVIAKTVGTLMTQRQDIRNVLCASIINLIETCQTDDEKTEIGKFAKNFLPILFNILLTEPKEEDPPVKPVMDCVKAYLSSCPLDTLHLFFEKMLLKAQDEDVLATAHTKKVILELLLAMIAHISREDLETVFSVITPWFGEPGNSTKQKRAYQILLSILDGQTDAHDKFVTSHLDEMYKFLIEALVLAQPAAKKHRLKCILSLVKKLDPENFDFIPSILPEIVLCVKEANEKSRLAAYKCLTAIGYIFLEKSADKREAMKSYVEMIIAGLTGTAHLASATLLCLSKIIYEYNSHLETEVMDQIVEVVVAMMESKHRDVLKGAIAFIKTAIGVVAYGILEPHVKPILDSFCAWEKPIRHHFRAKVKVLLERLLRRFGYELVYKLASDEHKKVVNHIVKEQRREKRAKNERRRGGDQESMEDSEDEKMEDFKELRGRGARSDITAKLVEGDNPLDFLDGALIPRIYQGTRKECALPERDGKFLIEDLAQRIQDANISDSEGEADSEDEVVQAQTNPFGRPKKGIFRVTKSSVGAGKKRASGGDGSSFKSKKASGDMKKKGKEDPYAYISINQKKGKKKSHGQFDKLIKAGKAGVLKGAKARKGRKSK